MKKKLLIIVMILISYQTSNATQNLITLKEYVSIISSELNTTFVISEDIQKDFSLMIPKQLKKDNYFKILVEVLNKNELVLERYKGFYLISKVDNQKENEKNIYSYTLKNIDYKVVKPLFNTFKDLNQSYISSSKTIVFSSTKKQSKAIKNILIKADKEPTQLKLKVIIVDTNLDKLKDYGIQLEQTNTYLNSHNFFFNLLAYPFTVTSEVSTDHTNQLNSFIRFMDTNDLSNVVSSPTLTLYQNEQTQFNIVKNIRYLNGTTTTNENTTTSITSYSYKDVGLKINVTPEFFNSYVTLDFELTAENILDNSDNYPLTSKNYVKQKLKLQKGKILALTGINQKKRYRTVNSTPFLSDLPFLGWLFKLDNDNDVESNLSIFLQLEDNEIYTNNNTNQLVNLPKPNISKSKELTEHQKRVNELLGINQ